VTKNPFSEFRELLQTQRRQLLDEVREKIAASGEGLGFVNQSKITDDDGLADAAAEMEVAMVIRESQELQEIEPPLRASATAATALALTVEMKSAGAAEGQSIGPALPPLPGKA